LLHKSSAQNRKSPSPFPSQRFIFGCCDDASGANVGFWRFLAHFKMKRMGCGKVRFCPSASISNYNVNPAYAGAGACDTAWVWNQSNPWSQGSYAMNGWFYSSTGAGAFLANSAEVTNFFNKEGNIRKPSLTPIFADSVWVDFEPMPTDEPNPNLYLCGGWVNPAGMERIVTPRHGWNNPRSAPINHPVSQRLPGGINIGLIDGHVEMPTLESLWNYSWHLNWIVPNPRPRIPRPRL
jgi:prepilin-type processing-associated H-X9-DG protein